MLLVATPASDDSISAGKLRNRAAAVVATAAIFVAAWSGPASAIETGAFRCTIEHATLVTDDGESRGIEHPANMTLTAALSASISRESPIRQLDVYTEIQIADSVSIEENIFAVPAIDLRSSNGAVYVNGEMMFRSVGDGRYMASGRAPKKAGGAGVVVYSGRCVKM